MSRNNDLITRAVVFGSVKKAQAAADGKLDMLIYTASGAVASFDYGADGVPVRDLTVQITPVREGSGDPSPENIRPIIGWTGANVYHSGADTSDYETHSVSWQSEAGTVWGGTINVTTGLLTVTHGEIASYAGEDLPGEWISDRDVYAAGTTPTTGAQVVYELAEPITYQLSGTEVESVYGENNIWADCGNMSVTYCADTKAYIDKMIEDAVQDLTGVSVHLLSVSPNPLLGSQTQPLDIDRGLALNGGLRSGLFMRTDEDFETDDAEETETPEETEETENADDPPEEGDDR